MARRQIIWRLIGLWLLASALCMAWAWFNIRVFPVPTWVDTVFGASLIIWLLQQTSKFTKHLARHPHLLRLSWILSLLALLEGILWAALSFVDRNLHSLLYSVLSPFSFANKLIDELRSGAFLTPVLIAQLALAILGLGALALITALASSIAGLSLRFLLDPFFDKLQTRFRLPPFRPERWLAHFGRIILSTLILIVAASIVAVAANARILPITWSSTISGPNASSVVTRLAYDQRSDTLYAETSGDMFRSVDGGNSWQTTLEQPSFEGFSVLFDPEKAYGTVVRTSESTTIWAVFNAGSLWTNLSARLNLSTAAIYPQSSKPTLLLIPFGNTIAVTDLAPDYVREPLIWLILRAIVWRITRWTADNLAIALAGTFVLLAVITTVIYNTLCRPFGIPLWVVILRWRHLEAYVLPDRLKQAMTEWLMTVRIELLQYGDVITDDLRNVPRPFRRYVLHHYSKRYADSQSIAVWRGRLKSLRAQQIQHWQRAWRIAERQIDVGPGMTSAVRTVTDQLAVILAETLGLTLSPARDFEAVRAYQAEAPTLRLNLPPRFPLLFIADPNPGAYTVQMLADVVDLFKESSYFALVIPLEPLDCDVDIAGNLRLAIKQSPHAQDFIVLGLDAAHNILIARRPAQALTRAILEQVDLSLISPFITNGPVRETMFFGRDTEIKLLIEKASKEDFAIIGNRKIGKTSLLMRARQRMEANEQVRVLVVDCQAIRDASEFYTAFHAQTGLALPSTTPQGFTATLTKLSHSELPLVLLLDEVDSLLSDERESGESLVSTWRTLSQRGICHFIFCGSTRLARRLDNPASELFNFPQILLLRYFEPRIAYLVLTLPLESLNIVIADEEALLKEMFALTSGHPALVQFVGKSLVEAANRRGDRRVVLEDIRALRSSIDFINYYLNVIWGEIGPLEKLITLIMLHDNFRFDDVRSALYEEGIDLHPEELNTALRTLLVSSILEIHEFSYVFIPRLFLELPLIWTDRAFLIAHEKQEFHLLSNSMRGWQEEWRIAGSELARRIDSKERRSVRTLAAKLCDVLGIKTGEEIDDEFVKVYSAETRNLPLYLPSSFPLVFIADINSYDNIVHILLDKIKEMRASGDLVLVVLLGTSSFSISSTEKLGLALKHIPSTQNFIILGWDDILEILSNTNPKKILTDRILDQIDLLTISPFIVNGAVPERMFFGRDEEVKRLVMNSHEKDFAIVGNRVIGKTSLLERVLANLQDRSDVLPFLINCQTVQDSAGFFTAFRSQASITAKFNTLDGFAEVVNELRKTGRTPVLLLDEVDALLDHEESCGEPLVGKWRELAQNKQCRFIFCGSAVLAYRLDDPESVFFNFPQPLFLRYLYPETAKMVLTQPLGTLGIIMEDQEALLDEMIVLTSGHPNLVQFVGKSLVEAANRRGERRVTLPDLHALRMSTNFTDYYVKIIWGATGPLEKLITLVAPPEGFDLHNIRDSLIHRGVIVDNQQIDKALKMLQIYCILDRHNLTYTFIPKSFHEILHRTQEVELLIEQEKSALKLGVA